MESTADIFSLYRTPSEPYEQYQQILYSEKGKEVLDYLLEVRKLKHSTIKHFKLGATETGEVVIPVFKDSKLIDYKFRSVKEKSFRRFPDSQTWVVNEEAFYLASEKGYLIVVEGEFDAMAVYQMGFHAVISGTGGAQDRAEWMARIPDVVKKIYVNYDNDEPGQDSAQKIAERIGLEKCYNVILPTKDANDFIRGEFTPDDYSKILRNSKRFNIKDVFKVGEVIEKLKDNKILRIPTFLNRINIHTEGGIPVESLIVMSGRTGVGKCFGKGTKILMYDGTTKTVEDIKYGDLLMGNDSTPRTVLSTTSGKSELYKVVPTKGMPYVVNREHILSLKKTGNTSHGEYINKGGIVNISLGDYLNKSDKFKHTHKGWRTGVEFSQESNINLDVSIEPYFLGLWLGDGNSDGVGVTTDDIEIKEYLNKYSTRLGLSTNVISKIGTSAVRIDITNGSKNIIKNKPLVTKLRNIGVLNNKHIPHVYKTADYITRINILAGLIDSDGSVSNGCYDYISKYEHLADDVVYLSRSLGFAAYKRKKICTIKSTGFSGEYYRVCISGNLATIPVKIKRKKIDKRQQKKDVLVTGIKVESIGVGDYYGFETDGNHLFLLEDFTVTHNSTALMNFLVHHANEGRSVMLISLENNIYFVVQRLLEVKYQKRLKDFTKRDWAKATKDLVDYPFYIDMSMNRYDMKEISKIIKQAKKLYNIEVLGFDHIGFLPNRKYNVSSEVAQMSRDFKIIARDTKIVIYLISHIRKIDKENTYITGEDLKDSSALQQDADMVFLLFNTREGMELSIDKARMSKSHLRIPILFHGDTGVIQDDMSRQVKQFDEVIDDVYPDTVKMEIVPDDPSELMDSIA